MESTVKRLLGLLLLGILILGAIGRHPSNTSSTTTVVAQSNTASEQTFDERARGAATRLFANASLRETQDHIRAAAMVTLYRQHCALKKELPESTVGMARGISLVKPDEFNAEIEDWDSNRRTLGDYHWCRTLEELQDQT